MDPYGVDPYLASEIAAAFINGVQSQHVGTSIKHFATNIISLHIFLQFHSTADVVLNKFFSQICIQVHLIDQIIEKAVCHDLLIFLNEFRCVSGGSCCLFFCLVLVFCRYAFRENHIFQECKFLTVESGDKAHKKGSNNGTSLCNTLASMDIPCSVNTYGNVRLPP